MAGLGNTTRIETKDEKPGHKPQNSLSIPVGSGHTRTGSLAAEIKASLGKRASQNNLLLSPRSVSRVFDPHKIEHAQQIYTVICQISIKRFLNNEKITIEDLRELPSFVSFLSSGGYQNRKWPANISDVEKLNRCHEYLTWASKVFIDDPDFHPMLEQVESEKLKPQTSRQSSQVDLTGTTPQQANGSSNHANGSVTGQPLKVDPTLASGNPILDKMSPTIAAGDQNNKSFKIAGHFTFGQAPTAITSFKSETFFAQAGSATVQFLGHRAHRNVKISPALQAQFDAEAKREAAAIKAQEEAAEKARLEKLAQQSKAEVKTEGAPASDPKNLDALSEAELLRKLKEKEQKLADVERQKQALLAQTSVQPKPKPCCEGCCTCDCTTAIAAFFGLRR